MQGVITLADVKGRHFVADGTGGVYLHLAGERVPRGSVVEVHGRSQPGLTVPYIDATQGSCSLIIRGEGPLPEPLKPEPKQLHDFAFDAQLVRGDVQRVDKVGIFSHILWSGW